MCAKLFSTLPIGGGGGGGGMRMMEFEVLRYNYHGLMV
jgi:hypothetical protein